MTTRNLAADNNLKLNFDKIVKDIVGAEEFRQDDAPNCPFELKRNYKALVNNFTKSKNFQQKNETCVKKIRDFCKEVRSTSAQNSTSDGLSSPTSVELKNYCQYLYKSTTFITSLSADLRIIELERSSSVLDTMCAAANFGGVLFESFLGATETKTFVLKCFIVQTTFIIEQYAFLADEYHKKANLMKYKEYLCESFLIFENMRSLLAEDFKIQINNKEFPSICKATDHAFCAQCYELQFTEQQLNSLHLAAFKANAESMQQKLKANSGDLNATDSTGFTPLHCAAIANNASAVAQLLNHPNINPNAQSKAGLTALHIAAIANSSQAATMLLEANDDIEVNRPSLGNFSALHFAVVQGNVELVKILLTSPYIDVNMASTRGWTALHMAVAVQDAEIFEALLKAKQLNVNVHTRGQLTPLHLATKLDAHQMVEALLEKGAEIGARTTAKLTAQQIAEEFHCIDALKVLEAVLARTEEAAKSTMTNLEAPVNDQHATETEGEVLKSEGSIAILPTASSNSTVEQQTTTSLDIATQSRPVPAATPEENTATSDIDIPQAVETKQVAQSDNITESLAPKSESSNQVSTASTGAPVADSTTSTPQPTSIATNTLTAKKPAAKEDANDLNSKLFETAAKGQLEAIKQLIAQGADVAATHETGKTILHFAGNLEVFKYFVEVHSLKVTVDLLLNAAERGQLEVLKYLIEMEGLNPHSLEGGAVICAAIPGNHMKVIKYLIEDQSIDVKQPKNNAPLLCALENNNFTLVKYLLDQGMDVEGVGAAQKPLLVAAEKSKLKMLEYLLERGAELQMRAFYYAAKGNNLEVLNYLIDEKHYGNIIAEIVSVSSLETIKYFVEAKKLDLFEKFLLHKAASNENLNVLQYFVEEQGSDVKARNDRKWVPLFYAAQANNLVAVKYFVVDRKMGIHLKDNRNRSALLIAAQSGSLDVVKYLVEECGANVNFTDNSKLNAFLASVSGGHLEVANYCLERGCDRYEGKALQIAVNRGNVDMLKLLIEEKGFDQNIEDENGENVLFHVISEGFENRIPILEYLIDNRKMDVNKKNNLNQTPLFKAVLNRCYETAKFLLQKGALVNVVDVYNKKPIDYVDVEYYDDIMALLK